MVLKGYPRLSETFIAQEIAALEARGLDMVLVSLRRPTDKHRHPVHGAIKAPVLYLPEYLYREPLRVLRGWRRARRLSGYAAAKGKFLADFRRDRTPNRVRRFGQACVVAAELPDDIGRLHAHFLHTPASVARYAAVMRGLPWSCSAHARDLWITPDWEKREKLADLDWLVTCTKLGFEHLGALAPDRERLALVYHGLDDRRFPEPPPRVGGRDGRRPDDPVILVSVGRAVPKKGYDDLLAALALLPADLHWRFVHVGGGAEAPALKQHAAALGIGEKIDWRGAQPQERVIEAYRAGDLFVLASKVDRDGDRDGLPNVLMEAQSQALACVATTAGAIGEFILDGTTGLLCPPNDPPALARAIAALSRDPARRAAMGGAGRKRVVEAFSFRRNIADIAQRFGLPEAPCASPSTRP
ncbi:MAG: glycosyltransferase family 4 protein [Alphaproteobacteria bacterium]|nr:glycosyltransferase family 4 protein [Alphaproteobacteria bacterium]